MRRLWLKIWRRPQLHRDLDSEMTFHREMASLHGNPIRLGNASVVREEALDLWRFMLLENLWRDLGYAARGLSKSPALVASAGLSLGLGIGANTAMFSVIDALLLRMLPVANPQELVSFVQGQNGNSFGFYSYPNYLHLRDEAPGFSGVAAIAEDARSNLTVNGPGGGMEPEPIQVGLVSGNYFSLLGVKPVMGRTFTAEDDRVPDGHPVAVISYAYWKRRFALAPDTVGRTFTLGATTYTILGVASAGFGGDAIGKPDEVWIPMAMQSEVYQERPNLLTNPNPPWLRMVARLKRGVTMQQAQAPLTVIFRRALEETRNPTPAMRQGLKTATMSLEPAARGFAPKRNTFTRPLMILMTVVVLVLLIACANLANLLLARAASRDAEMAVRLALGAGRGRLLRQLLTESVLLALLGGAASLAFFEWGTTMLQKLVAAGTLGIHLDLHPDGRVLAFTAALCLVTGLLFGLAPAFRGSKVTLTPALNRRGADAGARRGRFGLGKLLVVSQVALSLLLVTGAGLFLRTLSNLKSQDLGFDRQHVLLVWTQPAHIGRQGKSIVPLFQAATERVRALPGLISVSASDSGLLAGGGGSPVSAPGYTRKASDDWFVPWNLVAPKFFETTGTPLLLGRDFNDRDTETAPHVAIVSESFAGFFFPKQNPVGKRFGMRRDTDYPWEIVGVVKDVKRNSLRDQDVKMIYLPYRQDVTHLWRMCVVARTAENSPDLVTQIRQELRNIGPNLPVTSVQTMETQLDDSLAQERLIAGLSGFFGALAVGLACIGLYGVMSYTTARRTNEIGIRLALGAARSEVLGMVLRECLWLVIAGVALGVPAVLACARFVQSSLFGIEGSDPRTIGGAAVVMLAVAALAGMLPAWRAAKADPMIALRYE